MLSVNPTRSAVRLGWSRIHDNVKIVVYEFGPFRLDREARVLLKNDNIVPLTLKVLELLLALVEKRGHVVTKDDLMKTVWPDTFVEESNLSSNMSILRRQLGADPKGGEYIETIPKRGYRFIAAVTPAEDVNGMGRASQPPDAPELKPPDRRKVVVSAVAGLLLLALPVLYLERSRIQRINALAVLPLVNLSADPSQEYFADGITEALTADLAQIGSLRVISRISAMQYKNTKKALPEIARQLNVDAIISGSVLRSGQRVRVTAELIQVSTDRRLWARSYERNLGDVLDLQNEIARSIATEIEAKITPAEQGRLARNRVVKTDAYEAYLKGRFYWNQYTQEALEKSIPYFEQAIQLDSGYAAAYAGLADAWMGMQYIGAPAEEVHPKALEAASKALQLDPTLAEAHAVMSMVRGHEWNWAAAEQELRMALQCDPGYAWAHILRSNGLRHRGHTAESIAEAKRALELDPLSPLANGELGDVYLSARQYDRAIEQYKKTLELFPNQASARNSLGWAYVYEGLYDKGLEEINKSYGEDSDLSPEVAYVYAVSGRKPKAEKILQRLLNLSKQAPIPPHHFALIYAGLGKKEDALVWLEQAYQQHSQMMKWLRVDARFDNLRLDPRFQDLMRRVGLV